MLQVSVKQTKETPNQPQQDTSTSLGRYTIVDKIIIDQNNDII